MPETLYLIDGHAQIFRAYFAIRGGLTSSVTGEPTHAVFGFAGMLLKLFEQCRPHYVAMAIDSGGKTFRDELYDQYKANRQAPPDDFGPQVERILEMTRYFGIPILGLPGAEADDLIATCVQRILDDPALEGVHIRIVSKDKDLEQLLCERVSMFDIHTDTTLDVATLQREKGLTPEQVPHALALSGDKVDNVPGVEGVGPKTAAKLVQDYGTVQGVLDHLDEIKGKRRENIEKARAILPLSLQLVTLKRDLDFPFTLEDARAGRIDAAALKRFFSQMGFRRHLNDLERLLAEGKAAAPAPTGEPAEPEQPAPDDGQTEESFAASLFDAGPLDGRTAPVRADLTTCRDFQYRGILTADKLQDLVRELAGAPMLAVDTETCHLGPTAELCGISLAWKPGEAVYVPVLSPELASHLTPAAVLEALRPVLEDPAIPKCGHNLKYDLLVLGHAGVPVRGVAFDSMIAAHLLGYPGLSLNDLALSVLQHQTIPITDLIGPRPAPGTRPGPRNKNKTQAQRTMDQVPLEQIIPYAAEDADIALRLYEAMMPRLRLMGMERLAREVEMPLVEVLADMEAHGIRLNPDILVAQKAELAGRIQELNAQIQQAAGCDFNVDSPKQLADVLFRHMKLPVLKRNKTGPSTDVQVLERLIERVDLTAEQRLVPRLVLEYRELTKLVSTYLDALRESVRPATGRIHAAFHQTGTATGRLSSANPNLQNIPVRKEIGRRVRQAFVAEPGHRLITADYSQIELRVLAHLSEDRALLEAFHQDQDIHRAVAAQTFGVDPDQITPEQRAQAKTINFGIIYGVTPYGLSSRIEGLEIKDAEILIADYRRRFPGIDRFLRQCIEQAETLGYVTTILGRRRTIEQIRSTNGQTRALGERLAINSVVQGSAAELIKLAMVNLHRRIERERLPLKLLLQVHDELVCEAPAAKAPAMAEVIRQEMEQAMELRVPLKVDASIGENWLEAK